MILAIAIAIAAPYGMEERELYGHRFGQPAAVESAFVASHIAFRQGFSTLRVSDASYPGIPEPLELRLGGLTETLRLQTYIASGVSIWGTATGNIYSGANQTTALFLGAKAGYDVRFGAHARVHRSERTQVSLRWGVRRARDLALTPADLAVKLLDDTDRALSRLLNGRWKEDLLAIQDSWQATATASGAYVLAPAWGLQGSMTVRRGSTEITRLGLRTRAMQSELGGGVAIDWRPVRSSAGVQLGVQDRVDQASGLSDALTASHRLTIPLQLYLDVGAVQLGIVPTTSWSWRRSVSERQLGIEGRAVAWF